MYQSKSQDDKDRGSEPVDNPKSIPLVSAEDYAYDEYSSSDESLSLVSNADHQHDHFFDINQIVLKDQKLLEKDSTACA